MYCDFWDDRTIELYYSEGIHPCYGCADYKDDECVSNGACAGSARMFIINYDKFKNILKDYFSDRLIDEIIENMNDNDVFINEV